MSRRLVLTLGCVTASLAASFALGCAARSASPADAPTEPVPQTEASDDWTTPAEPLEADEPSHDRPSAQAISTPAGTIAWEHVDLVSALGPGWLLRQLDPVVHRPKGRFEGWRINAVFPDAPELCEAGCDLRRGDIIVAVEGDALETPTAYSALFERAPKLVELRVVRVREGVREQVTYRITPRPLPARAEPG